MFVVDNTTNKLGIFCSNKISQCEITINTVQSNLKFPTRSQFKCFGLNQRFKTKLFQNQNKSPRQSKYICLNPPMIQAICKHILKLHIHIKNLQKYQSQFDDIVLQSINQQLHRCRVNRNANFQAYFCQKPQKHIYFFNTKTAQDQKISKLIKIQIWVFQYSTQKFLLQEYSTNAFFQQLGLLQYLNLKTYINRGLLLVYF
eukprot:TRINITY_DN6013_c0_g3_i5.p1 TRINITY_DN6013_c0_g3~~TRINITY_DN6013_c0_g3_i5.p1  ORF type:complete len:201 (+),score=-10.29 TRINITY_DN6013_c0_g3_i5:463-1065(+)